MGLLQLLGMSAPHPAATYRYLRLRATASLNGSYYAIKELQYMVGATAYPTSAMTAASAPSPLVATESSSYAGVYPGWHCFDQNVPIPNHWLSNGYGTQWVSLDLGAGNGITPTAVKITAPDGSAGDPANECPTAFTILGSNTGSFAGEEVTLYTGSQSGWGTDETRTLTF